MPPKPYTMTVNCHFVSVKMCKCRIAHNYACFVICEYANLTHKVEFCLSVATVYYLWFSEAIEKEK